MSIGKLRWSILSLAFIVLLWGAYFGVRLGAYIPCFSCCFVRGRCGTCFLWSLQQNIGFFTAASFTALAGQLAIFSTLVILIGRAWCGWICPLGFVQDLLDLLRRKLGFGYVRFPEKLRRPLKSLKWIFLFIVLIVPLWEAFPVLFPSVALDLRLAFCQLCPGKYLLPLVSNSPNYIAVNFESATLVVMCALGLSFSLMVLIGALVKRRFWCPYCPLGLLMSWFRGISFLKLKKEDGKCTHCEICYNVCPMEIEEVFTERDKTDVTMADCSLCLKCIEYCPEEDALRAVFLSKTIYRSTNRGFFKNN